MPKTTHYKDSDYKHRSFAEIMSDIFDANTARDESDKPAEKKIVCKDGCGLPHGHYGTCQNGTKNL